MHRVLTVCLVLAFHTNRPRFLVPITGDSCASHVEMKKWHSEEHGGKAFQAHV